MSPKSNFVDQHTGVRKAVEFSQYMAMQFLQIGQRVIVLLQILYNGYLTATG